MDTTVVLWKPRSFIPVITIHDTVSSLRLFSGQLHSASYGAKELKPLQFLLQPLQNFCVKQYTPCHKKHVITFSTLTLTISVRLQ